MNENTFGLVMFEVISISVLTIVLCLPLISGTVEMNGVYGIRTKKAFKSKENWDAINRFGGKAFLIFSILYALLAVPLAIYFRGNPDVLGWISYSPILFILPGISISIFQRKLP
jgi:ABC-type phosphate transport system permease subunit